MDREMGRRTRKWGRWTRKWEDEDKDEEAEGLNSNARSLQREQDDDGGDQLQALEDQVRRLSIDDTAGLKPPSTEDLLKELMQDPCYR